MKYLYTGLAALTLLCSCGSQPEEVNIDQFSDEMNFDDSETEEVAVLENKEYYLEDLLELHATTESPEQIENKWIDMWFIQNQDMENSTATINDSTTYCFSASIDSKYGIGREFQGKNNLNMYANPAFYIENPKIVYHKGDTIHGKGLFYNDRFKGISIERFTPAK